MPDCSGLPDFSSARAHRVKGVRRGCDGRRGGARRGIEAATTLTDVRDSEKIGRVRFTGRDARISRAAFCAKASREVTGRPQRRGAGKTARSVRGTSAPATVCGVATRGARPCLPDDVPVLSRFTVSRRKTERTRSFAARLREGRAKLPTRLRCLRCCVSPLEIGQSVELRSTYFGSHDASNVRRVKDLKTTLRGRARGRAFCDKYSRMRSAALRRVRILDTNVVAFVAEVMPSC